MRLVYQYLLSLPENCNRMTYDQLLMTAAVLTLVISTILMISGRKAT